jgi:hypothetical protein
MGKRAFGQAVVVGDELVHRLFRTRLSSARVPMDLELPDRPRAMTFLFYFFIFFLSGYLCSLLCTYLSR